MENAINTSKCLHASINLLSSVKEIEIMPHAAHVCSLPCEARDTTGTHRIAGPSSKIRESGAWHE